MRKMGLIALAIIFFISSLPAQTETANEDYIKAMTTADPAQRANLLKEYLTRYAGKGTQYENYANANLCLLAYQGKTAEETINYGEKALALGGLDDLMKCQILITLSGIYGGRGQNLEKAKSYASQAAEIAKANRGRESEETARASWEKLLGFAYYAQAQAFDKAKDAKSAVGPYIESYKILNDKHILNDLKKVGKTLYDFKFYNEAEKAFGIVADVLKDFESYSLYARILHRAGKKNEALKYYKMAYMKQKSGETAFNIGIIEAEDAKSNPALAQEALNYFLEASFLSAAHSKKAMELAEGLFFNTLNKDLKYNEKVKEQQERSTKLEELTKTFNEKFGEKNEEDLTEAEKKEMQNLKTQIESEKNAIVKLGDEQKLALDKWNVQIEDAKKRLGIK
jgi:hypothetical protein